MATAVNHPDQAAVLLQKLSLDSQAKTLEIPEPTKKTSVYQYGSVDPANVANGQPPSYDRSVTPLLPEYMDPNTMCFLSNGYGSHAYYYGGGTDWEDYPSYLNSEGVDMPSGVYADVYHQGYGYAPYSPYSPATTPVPTVGSDGQLYAPQHYQYPTYFQPMTPNSVPFNSTVVHPSQGELPAEQKQLSVETVNGASNAVSNGGMKVNNGSVPVKSVLQNSFHAPNNSYGRGSLAGSFPATQDPRYGFDGFHAPIPWQDGSKYSDGQHRPVSSTFSKANTVQSSRNQSFRSSSQYTDLNHQTPMSGMGTTHGYLNRMYPNKLYGQYGSTNRPGMGYGSNGYDLRTNDRGWFAGDRYKPRARGNSYYFGNENMDGLNELNRGPRAKGLKNQKGPSTNETPTENEGKEELSALPDRVQYNREDFLEEYSDAKFFVIKSYSEDDVHKSIKYNVWASTPNGNKKLDAAYQEAKGKSSDCPVFLFFSVNTSGQFVGLAEMVGPVDFETNVEHWQQDKWTGSFPVKWHIVKDVPNSSLKHITLENNENKPVTNSRDTQEVKLEQGLKLIKIFKDHSSKTCILDDLTFYEGRQKTIQEKKAKQQQFQKQVWETKPVDETKELPNGLEKVDADSESAKEPTLAVEANGGDVKVSENVSIAKRGNALNGIKLVHGVSNGC